MAEKKNDITYTQTVKSGLEVNLVPNEFTWPGHEFVGWAGSASAENAEYEDQGLGKFVVDTDLYAVWKDTQVTILFDANGGGFGQSFGKKQFTVAYGTLLNTIFEQIQTPQLGNHEFAGWVNKDDGQLVKNSGIYVTQDMEFQALWRQVGTPAPEVPSTDPDGEEPSQGRWITPSEDESEFTVVNYANTGVITAFYCQPDSQLVSYNKQNPRLADSAKLFKTQTVSNTYTHPSYPGEFYFKVNVLPGADSGQTASYLVGTPKIPIWQRLGGWKFDGWVLCDESNRTVHVDTKYRNLYTDQTGKAQPQLKSYFINKRLLVPITVSSGCTFKGFVFYSTCVASSQG